MLGTKDESRNEFLLGTVISSREPRSSLFVLNPDSTRVFSLRVCFSLPHH